MGETKKAGAAHKALYRKYRSRSLDEVIGQEHITKTLANAIKQGAVSHAYLFTGPRGTGKTSVARILAHAINDLPYTDDSTHLDIIEIDAASNRRIDDIRELREKVHIAPVSAKYKVYIIDEVHMLTNESFNALLKTLEEPPEHVIFILATTEVHKLPATIISRTQRHSFRLIKQEQVAKHLSDIAKKEQITAEPEALELLARFGGGSFRDSISLLDQLGASGEPITQELVNLLLGLASEDSLQRLLQATKAGQCQQILQEVDSLIEAGLTPSAIAAQLIALLREQAKQGEGDQTNTHLMTELLGVASAHFPQLKLEAVLLAVSPKETTSAPQPTATLTSKRTEPVTQPTQPQPTSGEASAIPKTPVLSFTQNEAPKSAKAENSNLDEQWSAVLETTKQKNNPLYTVLRLATPELDDEGLLLIFAFPFHQKKIDEVKHKSLIASIFADVTGQQVEIRTVVDKTKARGPASLHTQPTADPARASLISNVQDIMGGGEIVDV